MNYALLLLAGSSQRFKYQVPKQFYMINHQPLYYYPLKALNDSSLIDGIIILTLNNKILDVFNFAKSNHLDKVKAVIAGGNTRNESVKFGLNKLKDYIQDNDLVLIHDAARPLLSLTNIETAIKETEIKGATTFALRSFDTLAKADNKYQVTEYIKRDDVFRIQTPQTFKYKIIKDAYQNFKTTNDDTELVFLNHQSVHLLKGSETLFKVTNFSDIKKVEDYLK